MHLRTSGFTYLFSALGNPCLFVSRIKSVQYITKQNTDLYERFLKFLDSSPFLRTKYILLK